MYRELMSRLTTPLIQALEPVADRVARLIGRPLMRIVHAGAEPYPLERPVGAVALLAIVAGTAWAFTL